MRRAVAVLLSLSAVGLVCVGSPAQAMTVKHETSSFSASLRWSCPGRDPVEHYTQTTRTTTFFVHGERVRVIDHVRWQGWIANREAGGAPLRDAGSWNNVYTYDGRRVIRAVTTGAIWRLTVPGHGIVVHQSGRQVYERRHEISTTPFMGPAQIDKLCRYV